MKTTIHLILTHHFYTLTASNKKSIEYRPISPHHTRTIWSHRQHLKFVTFHRGYSKITTTRRITKITTGPCPIASLPSYTYQIHSQPL